MPVLPRLLKKKKKKNAILSKFEWGPKTAQIIPSPLSYKNRMLFMLQIDNAVSSPLQENLRKGYQGFNGTDLVSQTWNLIMITVCAITYVEIDYDKR